MLSIMDKKEKIKELLTRGVEEVIDAKLLEAKLLSGKKLRVKLGIDPTSPNIHIGRAVVLQKLRAFQDLGHTAVFIVGDFTGLIGDTSDKDAERPMLSEAEVKKNIKSYFKQALQILDPKKTETHYNSKWLKKLDMIELAKIANLFGLHEFESREVIAKRMKEGKRVSFHELLYPIFQGYDSVMVKADVELGGTDQRFNLLTGRRIQQLYKQNPQDILTTTILEGTDGRKMSSSWGNVINLTDAPNDMYGKVMSIPDNLIEKYFLLASNVPTDEIKEILAANQAYDQKRKLALAITTMYHGEKKAEGAGDAFTKQFSKKELPDEISSIKLSKGARKLSDLLVEAGLCSSKSEARRLIEQNGVKVNQTVSKDDVIEIKEKNNLLVQVGKRKIIKIL